MGFQFYSWWERKANEAIRSLVSTHTGPIPQFSKSPSMEASPGPTPGAQKKGKRSEVMPSRAQASVAGSYNNLNPTTSAQRQQTQAFGGMTLGPSSQGKKQSLASNTENEMGSDNLRQQPANPSTTSGDDFFGLNALTTGLASDDLDFSNFDFSNGDHTRGTSQGPGVSQAGLVANLLGQQDTSKQAVGGSNANQGHAKTGTQTGNVNPDVNMLANVPVPSIERQLSATPAATAQGAQSRIGHVTSPNMPGNQQPDQPAQPQAASNPPYPPGYTETNAVYRDTHGVWY